MPEGVSRRGPCLGRPSPLRQRLRTSRDLPRVYPAPGRGVESNVCLRRPSHFLPRRVRNLVALARRRKLPGLPGIHRSGCCRAPVRPRTGFGGLSPNQVAVALWIEVGDVAVLLGSDLEKQGWIEILESKARPAGKASAFKVPHHGSKSAHAQGVWSRMLDPEPFAVLTPWHRGGRALPTQDDVRRILSNTPNAYATADIGASPRVRARTNKTVDRTIRESGISLRSRPARFDCGDRAARGCSGVSRSSAPRAISRTSPSNRALGIHHSPSSMFGVTTSTPRELVQVALVRRERHCPGSTICGAVEAVHRMWPARAGRTAIHPRVPPKIPRRRRHGRRHHHRAIVSRPQSPSARHRITSPNDAPRATRTSWPVVGGDGRASPPSRSPPT